MRATILVLLVVLVGGCGSESSTAAASPSQKSTSTPGSSTAINACSKVDAAAVQAAFGVTFSSGVETNVAAKSECDFAPTSGAGKVIVRFYTYSASASFDTAKTAFNAEDIPGIGDKAFWVVSLSTAGVLKGSHYFDVQAVRLGTSPKTGCLKLAEAIAAKI